MISALAVNIAVFLGALAAAFAIDSYVFPRAKLAVLPRYLQLITAGVAMTPYIYFQDRAGVGPIDQITVAFALSVLLWTGLPVLFAQTIDLEETEAHANC